MRCADVDSMVRFLETAADANHAGALCNLGVAIKAGLHRTCERRHHVRSAEEFELDSIAAFQLFMRAAELGHPAAQYNLGRALLHGEGTAADATAATGWSAASPPRPQRCASSRRLSSARRSGVPQAFRARRAELSARSICGSASAQVREGGRARQRRGAVLPRQHVPRRARPQRRICVGRAGRDLRPHDRAGVWRRVRERTGPRWQRHGASPRCRAALRGAGAAGRAWRRAG